MNFLLPSSTRLKKNFLSPKPLSDAMKFERMWQMTRVKHKLSAPLFACQRQINKEKWLERRWERCWPSDFEPWVLNEASEKKSWRRLAVVLITVECKRRDCEDGRVLMNFVIRRGECVVVCQWRRLAKEGGCNPWKPFSRNCVGFERSWLTEASSKKFCKPAVPNPPNVFLYA